MSDQIPSITGITDKAVSADAEPSMDDILASIRKIIANDETKTDLNESVALEDDTLQLDDLLVLGEEDFAEEDLNIPAKSAEQNDALNVEIEEEPAKFDDLDILELDNKEVDNLTENLVDDIAVNKPLEGELEGDNDLEELLNNVDTDTPDTDDVNIEVFDEPDIDLSSLESVEEETISSLNTVNAFGSGSALGATGAFASINALNNSSDEEESVFSDDIDLLLEDLAPAEELVDRVVEENTLDDVEKPEADLSTVAGESDIDMLKSLMADLMGDVDPASEALDVAALEKAVDVETLEDVARGEISDATDADTTEAVPEAAIESGENSDIDSVFDDILEHTIEGEELLDEELDIDPEVANLSADDDDDIDIGPLEQRVSSLLAIAAAAERDASNMELSELSSNNELDVEIDTELDLSEVSEATTQKANQETIEIANIDETNDLDETTHVVDLAKVEDNQVDEIEDLLASTQDTDENVQEQGIENSDNPEEIDILEEKSDDVVEEILTVTDVTEEQNLEQEISEMPRAVAKDTILDEVTEAATADAFASLNKVVEEKAVVAERGDRIGDLVQDALKPMLKEWLDANLKGIVERAVTKEVKRISSGK